MHSVFTAGDKVPTACDTCRKRKRKCDGATPTCLWCAAKGVECQYTVERLKRVRPSAAHVEDLKAEIDVLKQQVGRLQGSVNIQAHSAFMADEAPDQSPSSPASSEPITSRPFDNFSDPEVAQDISSLMWRLKIDDEGNTSFIGPSGNFCFTSTSVEDVAQPLSTSTRSKPALGETDNVTTDFQARDVDIVEMEEELLELFERFINPVYQFLGQETIRSLGAEPDTSRLQFLRLSTLSAAAILSTNAKSRKYGDRLFFQAEAMALSSCREQPTVSSVQALCLLGWRELGLENENMAWMYISMACSMTLHLGLSVSSLGPLDEVGAQESSKRPLASHATRSQTFWAVLFQERIATSLLGRHPLIPSTRVKAKGFLTALNRPPTLEEAVFDLHCELWFIHDKFMDKIYSFEFPNLGLFDRLKLLLEARESLSEFKQRLNLTATHPDDSGPTLYCQMSFYMSQLLIHRPFLHRKPQPEAAAGAGAGEESAIQDKSMRLAAQTSYQATGGMARLIRTAIRLHGSILLSKAPVFVVHSILTAAVTLLMFATSQQPQHRAQAISRFRTCFGAMHIASHTLPRARKGIAMLRDLANRWGVVSAIPLQYSPYLAQEQNNNLTNVQQDPFPVSMADVAADTRGPPKAAPTSAPASDNPEAMDIAKGHFDPWLFPLDDPQVASPSASSEVSAANNGAGATNTGSFDPLLFDDLNLDLEMDLTSYDTFLSYEPFDEQGSLGLTEQSYMH